MTDEALKQIEERAYNGMRNGNGYMAWVENYVLSDLLDEVKRLTAERDALLEESKLFGNCKTCIHCDIERYPLSGYCELGGCCGGCETAVEEEAWKWRGLKGE